MFMSFCVLSTLSGMSPAWLWIVLALANIGQTFIQVAMSNNVSRTLSKEQAGIGMGFYTMMTFMAGAASTAMIGKVLDALATVRLNPWQIYEQAAAYSNAFFYACLRFSFGDCVIFRPVRHQKRPSFFLSSRPEKTRQGRLSFEI